MQPMGTLPAISILAISIILFDDIDERKLIEVSSLIYLPILS